jgi:putative effector of murein hydrolase
MGELLNTPLFGLLLTLGTYLLGVLLHKKWPIMLFTPFAFAIVVSIVVLLLFNIPYETYSLGGDIIDFLITPATVSLAIILKRNIHYLKKYYKSILLGVAVGSIAHTIFVVGLALVLHFNAELIATALPKTITLAIAVGIVESVGGVIPLTVTFVVLTGISGAIMGPGLLKAFGITDPVAQGTALGSGAQAMGTGKAIGLGEVQGAMAGLAIILMGIAIVIATPLAMRILTFLSV